MSKYTIKGNIVMFQQPKVVTLIDHNRKRERC